MEGKVTPQTVLRAVMREDFTYLHFNHFTWERDLVAATPTAAGETEMVTLPGATGEVAKVVIDLAPTTVQGVGLHLSDHNQVAEVSLEALNVTLAEALATMPKNAQQDTET